MTMQVLYQKFGKSIENGIFKNTEIPIQAFLKNNEFL